MKRICFALLILIFSFCFGCSGSGDSVSAPDETQARAEYSDEAHALWAMYQFHADPIAGTLEFVPIRAAEMHLNALPFLEPPALLNLTLESFQFNGNIMDADIGLRHPFLGLTEFSGFDVSGILISNGNMSGFDDPDIMMSGEGDTRLLNPDGLTRWWNPVDFPVNEGTILSYNDGMLGTPNADAEFNCTLNGYKYFCDDLVDPDAPLSDVDPEGRGVFSAGQKNVRHYSIDLGAGLVFNYAVDASWRFPANEPPWIAPDDFNPAANRPEAWWISAGVIENTMYNDGEEAGGDLLLAVDVYDWFNADLNTVKVESGDNFTVTEVTIAAGSGTGYSTYEIEVLDVTPVASGDIEIFITVTCEATGFGGLLPGEPQSAYAFMTVTVDDEAPGPPPTSEWTMYQHDARHTGYTSVVGPQTNNVAYTQLHQYGNATALLTGPGDGIYCTFYGTIYATRPLQAVDRDDGSLLWMQDFGCLESEHVKALCVDAVDGSIYAYYSQDGTLCKLNPANGANLVTPLGGFNVSASCYGIIHSNGNIYVGSGDSIRCVDSSLNAEWTSPVGSTFYSMPTEGINGDIITGGGSAIRSLNPDTGALNWSFSTGATVYGAPTILTDGTIVATVYSNHVYAINPNGSQKWNAQPLTSDYLCGITSAAEGPNGDVYIVMNNSYPAWQEQLIRLNPATGALISTSGTTYNMKSSSTPTIGGDGTIYVNGSYNIYAFNPDCTLKWTSSTVGGTGGGQAMGPCAIDSNGNLFAASGTHGFICISDE